MMPDNDTFLETISISIVLVLFSADQTNSSTSFRLLKLSRIAFRGLFSFFFVSQIPFLLLNSNYCYKITKGLSLIVNI